jgi:hypothetical protein
MRPLRAWALSLCGLGAGLGCSADRPPPAGEAPRDDGAAGQPAGPNLTGTAGSLSGPCGDQRIPAVNEPPNLSFVLDRSGSMSERLAGSTFSKYENARIALSRVLSALGHRVNYGAAVFPGLLDVTGCEAGEQLLEMGAGDAPSYARKGELGPRLLDLLRRLDLVEATGGTPVAATLGALLPVLGELEGETSVVLLTDGAPNCNAELACASDQCIPNIEGASLVDVLCDDSFNCCAPSEQRPAAALSCVDHDQSVAAVAALADAGIRTFVVGMPGSEPYIALLNAMADAGGTARAGDEGYYAVGDTAELSEALTAIAASVAISCEIGLDYEPPDRNYVNVYFDEVQVPHDPANGWSFGEAGQVWLHGAACDRLSSGEVLEVQILAGCKTVVK